MRRRHLPQISGSLGPDVRRFPVQLSREPLKRLVKAIVGEQLAHLPCIGGKTRPGFVADTDALQDPPGADPVEGARHCGLLDGFVVHLPPRPCRQSLDSKSARRPWGVQGNSVFASTPPKPTRVLRSRTIFSSSSSAPTTREL